ncbi:hypothetical protein C8R44DRAFT_730284 [Mycena epipterygia]|nr:hypothetical protein C8R44DRAFT_730284 [Mycena epipterygia]
MNSNLPGSLSAADEAIFLLRYRWRPHSFVIVPELGDGVFALRSMMHANRAHLGASPSALFQSVQDFAGEIVRKRQLFEDRQRANAEREQAASATAARIARKLALEPASNDAVASPSGDTVSIPSSSCDESGMPDLVSCSSSPIASSLKTEPDLVQPSSRAVPLSPLFDLQTRLSRLSLSTPLQVPLLAKLSVVVRPIPTGPRAGLRPQSAPVPRKRRRVEKRSDPSPHPPVSAPSTPYARPSRAVQYASGGAALVRPASESQLRQRLVAVQAEIRRYSSAQKELFWQLQTLRQLEPADSSATSQEEQD